MSEEDLLPLMLRGLLYILPALREKPVLVFTMLKPLEAFAVDLSSLPPLLANAKMATPDMTMLTIVFLTMG